MMVNNKEINSFINKVSDVKTAGKIGAAPFVRETPETKTFKEVLLERVRLNKPELVVSKHAKLRAEQRNIDIDLEKINLAVVKAADKNLKNVLVLSAEAAFIVSVDNNVLVTAMSGEDMRENVITNIDGTVII
ncbi:MAG: hypothetical protein FWH24_04605 [Oscillospiraceae bacterium]|nr:hypothetical protein [Oscillospiraceae bacterium]